LPQSNPFVDVATHLFLEALAEEVGVPGLNNYLRDLSRILARSMPEEEFDSWDDLLDALADGRCMLAAFERVVAVTPHCLVTPRSPFERGWREYVKRVGQFAPVHRDVAVHYNATVRPSAITSFDIILQTFRETAASRIRVDGRSVRYAPIATAWMDGTQVLPPEGERAALLAEAGITEGRLRMLLRDNADVSLLVPRSP
jgi:hypothetical protein